MHVASLVASHTCTATMLFSHSNLFFMPSKKSNDETFPGLSNPAKRALSNAGVDSLKKLSSYTEKEVLKWHGLGPASIPILKKLLSEKGLSFKS